MGRIFSGKTVRDTEIAAESLINPTLSGNLPVKTGNSASRLTVKENQQETPQMDDFTEKKRRK